MRVDPTQGKLVLVVDDDEEARRDLRALLESRGLDVVNASTGQAALELIQRLPASFHLVVIELELRGLPGVIVVETLRLFRPELPIICLTDNRAMQLAGCLRKPLIAADLDEQLATLAAGGAASWTAGAVFDEQAVTRARARYAAGGDLIEAALELARALPASE
jgi:CheY-like chemotaxis protein